MKVKQKLWMIPVAILALVLMWSCYPDSGISSVAEYDVVVTLFDKDANFSAKITYVLMDTVIHVGDSISNEDNLTREHDELILSEVQRNLNQYGWTEKENPNLDPGSQDFDVQIWVAAAANNWQGYYSYPGWGGGYWPGWGYPWYPYYPPYWGTYSYTTGTLFIQMWDVDKIDPDKKTIASIWMATNNGLLGGDSSGGVRSRITKNIDQAFVQSPYLKK